jgi:predicted unusual protein kinase regulating ubiquinone biosynthesis (AarF/ABC1/UbiB family)
LEIAVRELFEWGEMQTDPNFGNYLVRLGNGDDVKDKIVLLDLGRFVNLMITYLL